MKNGKPVWLAVSNDCPSPQPSSYCGQGARSPLPFLGERLEERVDPSYALTFAVCLTISAKSAALRLAPPTSAPSRSGWPMNSAILDGVTLPPY